MILGLSKRWSIVGFLIASILVLPLLALIFQSLSHDEKVFGHLLNTVLPTYITNTLSLMVLVALGSLFIATPAAWLIARCNFVGHKVFQWALLLPLAMPAYLVAYVYTDLFDYAGPVQKSLRTWCNWQSSQDYYFPEVRSIGGAAIMLSLVLFPYIYLLARTSFKEQSISLQQAARVMGCSPWQSFWRLSLPMARPALAVGMALVIMETVADFATVSYFAVPTLTTAVYDTWLGYGSLAAASKLSVIILLVIFMTVGFERFARRKQQVYQKQAKGTQNQLYSLKGIKSWLAFSYCLLLLSLAFLLPFAILLQYAWQYFEQSWNASFIEYSLNSLTLSAMVSVLCVLMALLLIFIRRMSPYSWDNIPSRLVAFGYALPGTVLAIGILVPLIALDFAINDVYLWLGKVQPGLILSGSIFALIFAFCVRFAAISIGSVEASYKNISPSLDYAAVTMGQSSMQLFFRIHLPLLRKGILVGMLLVFIESMKELPAVLLLRPIGYENLATHVFQFISDEQLELGALAAIVIVLVGLIPLIFLNQQWEKE